MTLIQENRCAICGEPPGRYSLNVDHDHATGRVRGLLCARCNQALERFEAVPNWAERVQAYLEESRICLTVVYPTESIR